MPVREVGPSASPPEVSDARDESLSRDQRLRRGRDYRRCYRRGRRRTGAHLILYFVANGQSEARLGTTLSRKVGNSVVRHRIKRRVREIFRRWPRRASLPALDLVVHVKPGAAEADFETLEHELLGHLEGLSSSRRGRRRR